MTERYISSQIIERDESRIPLDTLNKLWPFANKIDQLLQIPLDFPHGPLHVSETKRIARSIIEVLTDSYPYRPHLDGSLESLEKIDLAITYHDSGYVFSKLGVLRHEDHNIGSWFIAKSLGLPKEVCWGILKHQRDKIPEYYPLWLNVLYAADRSAGMGYSGLLREIFYMGVDHPVFSNPTENSEKLVDLRDPNTVKYKTKIKTVWCFPAHAVEEICWTDYESKAKDFYTKEILPKMTDTQKRNLLTHLSTLMERFDGGDNMTPIIIDAQGTQELKYFNTYEIYNRLMGINYKF